MRFITLLARKANTTKNIAFTANTAKRNSYVSRLGFPRVSLGRNMKENCHARVNAPGYCHHRVIRTRLQAYPRLVGRSGSQVHRCSYLY